LGGYDDRKKGSNMRVNVFTPGAKPSLQDKMLVLPDPMETAIPDAIEADWRYFATVDTGDGIFGEIAASAIEAEISSNGYALVQTARP
jgi:hypothetical protein